MCLSMFFAQMIGFYLVIASLGTLIHHQRYRKISHEFLGNPALVAISENLSLIFGLMILVLHHVWVANWPVLITIIGWILVLRGVLAIFFPIRYMAYSKYLLERKGFLLVAWVSLLVGLYLLWLGFTRF